MTSDTIEERRRRYARLNARLTQLDDSRLQALCDEGSSELPARRHRTLDVDGSPVFVKRLPLTNLERDNAFSTRNLYHLPLYYNYGIGSVGLGVFRELTACIRTSDWVLAGEIETFPLLYHHRILRLTGARPALDPQQHDRYVAYWGNDPNIGRYMHDRARAEYDLVLFLEHSPLTLLPWLDGKAECIGPVLADLFRSADFLREKGVVHFDAHFNNVVTDGWRRHLTDWGLVLDRSFELDEQERAFLDAHRLYDYATIISCLSLTPYRVYVGLAERNKQRLLQRVGLPAQSQVAAILPALIENIETLATEGLMPLDRRFVDDVVKYRAIILLMDRFYTSLRRNPHKDTLLPLAEVRRLLIETGVIDHDVCSS